MNQVEYQRDFFEYDRLIADFASLKTEMARMQKAAFAQIGNLRKEIETLEAHCQVMSDELFKREDVS